MQTGVHVDSRSKKFAEYFVGGTVGALVLIMGVLASLPSLGITAFQINATFGLIILTIAALSSIIIGFTLALWKGGLGVLLEDQVSEVKPPKPGAKSETSQTVVALLTKEYDDGKYHNVVRYGRSLSRPLWVDGHYDDRITVGNLVYQAATSIGEAEARAWALIDDLGWTYVIKGNSKKAEENIKRGLDIALAQAKPNAYLVAKGYRHLAGIHFREKNFGPALDYNSKAEVEANEIRDEREREEMLAGVQFSRAELHYEMSEAGAGGNLNLAETDCIAARTTYEKIGDNERQVKIYSLLSRIYAKKGELEKASEMAFLGLEKSQRTTRKDEIVRNLINIGRLQISRGEKSEAERNLKKALKEAEAIGLEEEKRLASEYLNRVKNID